MSRFQVETRTFDELRMGSTDPLAIETPYDWPYTAQYVRVLETLLGIKIWPNVTKTNLVGAPGFTEPDLPIRPVATCGVRGINLEGA